jgi:hypothetical protein
MASSSKTIQINPLLFHSGKASKAVRSNASAPATVERVITPLVSPHQLKHALLRRIHSFRDPVKDAKGARQTLTTRSRGGRRSRSSCPPELDPSQWTPSGLSESGPSDSEAPPLTELDEALSYLSSLQRHQQIVKPLQSLSSASSASSKPNPTVHGGNGKQASSPSVTSSLAPSSLASSPLSSSSLAPSRWAPSHRSHTHTQKKPYVITDSVPYGCLKGGLKQTFREWKASEDARPPTPPKKTSDASFALLGGAPTPPPTLPPPVRKRSRTSPATSSSPTSSSTASREERLRRLRDQLARLEGEEAPASVPTLTPAHAQSSPTHAQSSSTHTQAHTQSSPAFLRRTVKRTFTLGRRPHARRVSVLLKDQYTRKQIQRDQTRLAETPLPDMRTYLRDRGLLRAGSFCPPELLRDTFCTAMMTGEVTNTHPNMRMHNFLHGASDSV